MRILPSLLLLGTLLLVACQSADAPAESDAAATDASSASAELPPITITASDYAFQAPASVEGGPRTVRLVNTGAELHHVQFVRIDDGYTMDDLMAAYGSGDHSPDFAHDVGGPNLAPPGGEFSAIVNLRPGRYAVLCLIPSPDMVEHVEKGMMAEMEVTAPTAPARPSQADLVLTMRDYSFDFSSEITAGTNTIRIETDAPQSHELVIFGLPDGVAAQDILAWVEGGQQGPPPFRPVGGITGLSAGEVNEITVDFAPGRYAFICFVPDAGDGAPHFVHGMMQEYVVS